MGKTAILLIDHGSVRADANASLHQVERMVQDQVGPDTIVRAAHMELAEPTIAQGFDACVAAGADEVIAHPYMLAPGRHATTDIPRLVAEAAARHPGVRFRLTEPLGVHRLIGAVVLDRCGLPARV